MLDACGESPACAAAHPDLAGTLDAIRDRLGPEGRDVALTDPRTGEAQTLRLTFDHVIGALQPLTYAPELSALLPEVIGRAAAGDFGPLFAARCGDGQSGRAVERRAALLGHLRGGRSAHLAGRRGQRRWRACAPGRWPSGRSPSARVGRGGEPGRRGDAGRERRAGADPLRRARSGHAARERRRGREDAAGSRHIVARGYGHIVSPHCLRAAPHRGVRRRSDLRHASRRRASSTSRRAPPRRSGPTGSGRARDRRRGPGESLRSARRRARGRRRLVHGAPTARSRACSGRTAPARRRCCACSPR